MVISKTLTTVDKHKISCLHFKTNHPNIVVIVHGFYNSKETKLLQALAKSLRHDYDVFMFDFRGHGKTSGLFTWTSKEGNDLQAVLEYLETLYDRIGIISFSLGAYISINLLSRGVFKKVASLVCISCPTEFEKIEYKFWELDLEGDLVYTLFSGEGLKGRGVRPGPFWLKKEKPIVNVRKLCVPVLYIHGEKDWVIKPWHSCVLYEKTISRKRIRMIKNGPHAEYLLRDNNKECLQEIRDWLRLTMLRSKR